VSPLVSNGVVFAGGTAWDANGVVHCSGSPPVVSCTPIATVASSSRSASLSVGTLFLRVGAGIEAFQAP